MENTLENKKRFFDQYSGQEIIAAERTAYKETPFEWYETVYTYGYEPRNAYAELTPLSAITDEHALMVASLMWTKPSAEKGRGYLSDDIDVQMTLISDVVDLVRSLGYAVRWNSISVEEQIKMGWIKLREDV